LYRVAFSLQTSSGKAGRCFNAMAKKTKGLHKQLNLSVEFQLLRDMVPELHRQIIALSRRDNVISK